MALTQVERSPVATSTETAVISRRPSPANGNANGKSNSKSNNTAGVAWNTCSSNAQPSLGAEGCQPDASGERVHLLTPSLSHLSEQHISCSDKGDGYVHVLTHDHDHGKDVKGSHPSLSSSPSPSSEDQRRRHRHGRDRHLLTINEVPVWYAANRYIQTGYRPLRPSTWYCFSTALNLSAPHNETANIWSHLIPAVAAVLGHAALWRYFALYFPDAHPVDQLVMHIFLTGAMVCFSVSATYHALLCHSQGCHDVWLRMDYFAIIVQILGSFVSGIYMGFYCESGPRTLYWSMSMKYRILRLGAFVATSLSGFAPILHAMTIFPYDQLDRQAGIRYYYLEAVFYLTGAIIYGIHFPEKWKPITFDVWGSSHQIFHCCVVMGAMSHFYGVMSAYEYTYNNPRC